MADKNYGLEFEYHDGKRKKEWFSESKQKSVFNEWAAKLNKPGYKDPKVKAVSKVYK